MHIRSLAMASLAALSIIGFAAPSLAVNPPPIVIHLFDVESEDSVTTPDKRETTGSIGTHGGAQGHPQPNCDPRPTAYDEFYSFCEAAVYNVTSLSERSTGVKVTKGGTTYSCTTTSYSKVLTYDGSGSIYNPNNWDVSISSTDSTVDGRC